MKKYEAKKFNIGNLKGISQKNIEEHYKLYEGYVKNSNLILEKVSKMKDDEENSYAVSEMQRRFSFEFNGMRNHEYYFESLSGGQSDLDENSGLYKKITEDFGSLHCFRISMIPESIM
jgi:Fe-Mn family superoxide dismutase